MDRSLEPSLLALNLVKLVSCTHDGEQKQPCINGLFKSYESKMQFCTLSQELKDVLYILIIDSALMRASCRVYLM